MNVKEKLRILKKVQGKMNEEDDLLLDLIIKDIERSIRISDYVFCTLCGIAFGMIILIIIYWMVFV